MGSWSGFFQEGFSLLGTCLKLQVVLVDESFVTKRKHNKGGFIGRTSRGHITTIFAAVEMTTNEDGTHTETGRAMVEDWRLCPTRRLKTLARIMKQYIMPGSAVCTDGLSHREEDPCVAGVDYFQKLGMYRLGVSLGDWEKSGKVSDQHRRA